MPIANPIPISRHDPRTHAGPKGLISWNRKPKARVIHTSVIAPQIRPAITTKGLSVSNENAPPPVKAKPRRTPARPPTPCAKINTSKITVAHLAFSTLETRGLGTDSETVFGGSNSVPHPRQ